MDKKIGDIHRALILQGGGSLGAYEAGAYKAIIEELSSYLRKLGKESEPIFHIVAGTSIGAINAAIIVSYVKEKKTWEGSAEKLVDFWEYLSAHSYIENIPYFKEYWDYWHRSEGRIASGESARRYFSTKEFIYKGVPNVFRPKIPISDNRFFDPSNTWYLYDSKPLKESLIKFAKFPLSTSFENNEPRLLLVAVDVQEGLPVVFDSYEKEDGTRKSEYGRIGQRFEHVIRYEDGIKADFVMASASVPVNYDYTMLNVENYSSTIRGQKNNNNDKNDKNNISRRIARSDISGSLRPFWDGGLLANTALRQAIFAHRYYWHRVRKLHDIPRLRVGVVNLHPLKLDKIPFEYDGVLDRKNDIMFHDRTEFDENVAVLISDYVSLGKELVKLAEENGVSREKVQKILQEKAKSVQWDTGKHITYDDLIKGQVDVDFVIRMERKNDVHTISNKTFDFSTTTVRQLIHDGYMECKESLISSGVISSKGN